MNKFNIQSKFSKSNADLSKLPDFSKTSVGAESFANSSL